MTSPHFLPSHAFVRWSAKIPENAEAVPMRTLLLSRSDVERALDRSALADQMRTAFTEYSMQTAARVQRVRAPIGDRGTGTVLFPGMIAGVPAYTVKAHAKFPGRTPAIRGVLCLHDSDTGELLAVMDSTHLTAVRTGIAGALAAHTLARVDADHIAVVGAGVQGTELLRALATMRRITRVSVYDLVAETAAAFARRMAGELGVPVHAAATLPDALGDAGIVFTATWSRQPFIAPDMLARGCHVTTLGPDEPGKAELAAEVIRSGLFVADDRALAAEMGAPAGVGLGAEVVAAELGEVLAGRHPGRTSAAQLTVYGGVGLAFQDAVAAWAVYRAAGNAHAASEFDFLQ